MHNFDKLGKKISEVDAVMDAWMDKLGIGYNHYAVLYSLASAAEKKEQCTQKQICNEWRLPKQTIFNICKDYKQKGWIEFSESGTDKRERIMHLTKIGRANAEFVWQATNQLSEKTFALFGEQKAAEIFALLTEFCEVCYSQIEKTKIKKS